MGFGKADILFAPEPGSSKFQKYCNCPRPDGVERFVKLNNVLQEPDCGLTMKFELQFCPEAILLSKINTTKNNRKKQFTGSRWKLKIASQHLPFLIIRFIRNFKAI